MNKKEYGALIAEAHLLSIGIVDSLSILYSYNFTCRDNNNSDDIARSDRMVYVIQEVAKKLEHIMETCVDLSISGLDYEDCGYNTRYDIQINDM